MANDPNLITLFPNFLVPNEEHSELLMSFTMEDNLGDRYMPRIMTLK